MGSLSLSLRRISIALWLAAMLVSPLAAHEGLHDQISEATRQIKVEPQNARLYLQRGELHRLHGDWRAALADYRRVEQLNSSLDEVRFARGRMYFEAGKAQQARIWLDRFLFAHPNHVDALVTRARVLVKLNHRLAAVKDYARAIASLAKPKPEYYIERAKVLVIEGRKDEALVGIDEGIQKLGAIVTLQLFAIDLELSSKRYDAALYRLEQISAQSPRKESWLARRGLILVQAGREDESREAFKAALSAIESLPPSLRGTSATMELEGQVRAAIGSK
jgi:tetratricopeptide (TPR) repeat protein